MTIIIEIYLIICVCLLLFDIVFLLLKNHKNQEFYPRNESMEEQIRQEIAHYREEGWFSKGFEEELTPKLSNIRNLITLMDLLEKDTEAAGWFRPAVLAQFEEYQKKNDYEQAYYAYVVSKFDYGQEPVPPEFAAKFIEFLDSKSLYTFANTMDAIYQFGETNLLLIALDKVDERHGSYHQKLLIDGLLTSRADFQELSNALVSRFAQYTPFLQESLLNFFRMQGHDVSDLCMQLIMKGDNVNAEVRYSAMRYFTKYPTAKSRALFLDLLQQEGRSWIEQMLAIEALENDGGTTVRKTIMTKVSSANWYVRTKAIAYLHKHGLSKEEIFDILYLQDKYANDALLYQYRESKEFSRYIIDTIHLLRQQAESGATQEDIQMLLA